MTAFFKNAQVYKLADKVSFSADELSEKMSEHEFGPCQEQQAVSMGWFPAIPDTENKVHVNGDNWLICLKRQERILPPPVLRKALAEKIDQIQKGRRPPGRIQRTANPER